MSGAEEQVITNDQLLTGFSEYLRRQAKSRHTVRAYLADVRKLLQFLQQAAPEHRLAETTPNAIDGYVQHLEAVTPSDSSVKRQVMGLRQFFSFLVRQKHMQANPIRNVSVVHLPIEAIPADRMKRAFEYLFVHQNAERQEDSLRYMRDEVMLLFMLILGVRQYQMPLLRVSNMKKENGAYDLTVGPNFIVKVEGLILTLLHNYLKARQGSGDTIFIEPLTNRPITAASIHAILTELTYAAGFPITPKTIRHTFERFQANPQSADAVLQWVAELHRGRAAD